MIEVVLLDLGGVLVELGGVRGLQRLLGAHLTSDAIHELWGRSSAVLSFENGQIDADAFAVRLVEELRLELSPTDFLVEFASWIRLRPGARELVVAIPAFGEGIL